MLDHLRKLGTLFHERWSDLIAFDVETTILGIALAYLIYGLIYTLMDFAADRKSPFSRMILKVCHRLVLAVIYLISALYWLEYVAMRVGFET